MSHAVCELVGAFEVAFDVPRSSESWLCFPSHVGTLLRLWLEEGPHPLQGGSHRPMDPGQPWGALAGLRLLHPQPQLLKA